MSLSEAFTRRLQQEPTSYIPADRSAVHHPATRHQHIHPVSTASHHAAAPHHGQSSRHRGVSLLRRTGRWHAQINFDGRQIHLGFYAHELEAAAAYDRALLIKWAAPLLAHAAYRNNQDALLNAFRVSPPQTNLGVLSYTNELPIIAGITPARLLAALGDERLRKSAMDALAHGFVAEKNDDEDEDEEMVDFGEMGDRNVTVVHNYNTKKSSNSSGDAVHTTHKMHGLRGGKEQQQQQHVSVIMSTMAPATPKIVVGRNLKNNRRKPAMPIRGSLD